MDKLSTKSKPTIKFYDFLKVSQDHLKYAVIMTRFQSRWIFVRHKERFTWEVPGGRREPGEKIEDTASRELVEETGAKIFHIKPVCFYSVNIGDGESFGKLFLAEVTELGSLGTSEIAEVILHDTLPDNLTYPHIQPELYHKVLSLIDKHS